MPEYSEAGKAASSGVSVFLKTFAFGIAVVLSVQLYYKPADKRPYVLCLLPYKAHKAVWVDMWGGLFIKDNASYIKHSLASEGFFNSCIDTTGNWSILKKF